MVDGLYGRMMRGAKWVESAICEPPKPRLTAGSLGNDFARSQRPMVELPQKKMPPSAGGFARSRFSMAATAFSQRAGDDLSFSLPVWAKRKAAQQIRAGGDRTRTMSNSGQGVRGWTVPGHAAAARA